MISFFFIVDERRYDPNTTYKRIIIGTSAKHNLNDVSLACRCWSNVEWLLGNFVIFQGIRTSIARITCIIVIFRGVTRPTCPPPTPTPSGSAHVQRKSTENRHSQSTIKETKLSKMIAKPERTLLRNYIAKTITKHHPTHTDLYRQRRQQRTVDQQQNNTCNHLRASFGFPS